MLTTFTSSSKKTETGLQVVSGSRGFQVLMDEPKKAGGANTGMTPVEIQLSALGGCLTIVCSLLAEKMRLDIEEINIDVEGDLDPDGLAAKEGVRPGFQAIRYTLRVKTSEPEKKIEKMVTLAEKLCPIHDTLSNPVNVIRAGIVLE